MNDWRLRGQKEYLKDAVFEFKKYYSNSVVQIEQG